MKFKNVLIASDFDGTLKNDDGFITDDVMDAVKYFISEGGLFTVCTGRVYQGFHLYNDEYINAPVLLGNGAMAYDYKNKKVIFNDGICEEGIDVIKAVLNRFSGIPVELYSFDNVYSINAGEDSIRHFTSQDINFVNIESPEEALLPWTKVMIYAKGFSGEVQSFLDGYTQVNYLKTTGDYVELLRKGVDKGFGLLKLGDILGCHKEDIYAVGDGYNDVEMLIAASKGFVPENGSKEALNAADYITRSNNNGCIANVIEILDSIY